jgi:hypothetical protein
MRMMRDLTVSQRGSGECDNQEAGGVDVLIVAVDDTIWVLLNQTN